MFIICDMIYMIYDTIYYLYYIILYYIILYYIILYYIILYYILFYFILFYFILLYYINEGIDLFSPACFSLIRTCVDTCELAL